MAVVRLSYGCRMAVVWLSYDHYFEKIARFRKVVGGTPYEIDRQNIADQFLELSTYCEIRFSEAAIKTVERLPQDRLTTTDRTKSPADILCGPVCQSRVNSTYGS